MHPPDDELTTSEHPTSLPATTSERMTIEVIKRLVSENPVKMAYALQDPMWDALRRMAILLILVGKNTRQLLLQNLEQHERSLLLELVENLSPPALIGEQVEVLTQYTEVFLRTNASLFGENEAQQEVLAKKPPSVNPESEELLDYLVSEGKSRGINASFKTEEAFRDNVRGIIKILTAYRGQQRLL
ncbi:MAG: hypothetical protein NUV54_02250 [Candidatus Taylorbacteria bacterium]|nr:hypothetical protein [Candidatus Taylorbacteria bacterium]